MDTAIRNLTFLELARKSDLIHAIAGNPRSHVAEDTGKHRTVSTRTRFLSDWN